MNPFDEIERLLVGEDALLELMRTHVDWVSKCLADGTHKSWPPALAVLVKKSPDDKDGEMMIHILAVDFNEHDEKHETLRLVGRKLYAEQKIPVAAVMSSECWLSKQRGGQNAKHCEPRHDPARQEGIVIQGLTLGNKHTAVTFAAVERDGKEQMKVAPFGEIVKAGEAHLLQSLFLGFFAEPARKAGITLPEG